MKRVRLLAASCCAGFPETASLGERVLLNRRMILECLNMASSYEPDFVCFPELVLQQQIGSISDMLPFAERIPGKTAHLVAAKARTLRSHVIFCTVERDGDRLYNTAVLAGRDGSIIGNYRKYHATAYEMRDGIDPGEEIPVWKSDCGPVGCAISFDLKFPEVGLALSRGGARVVFSPTTFLGGQRMISWAMDYGFYMVRCQATSGLIVDPTGAVVATEGPPLEVGGLDARVKWTFAEVNIDRKTYHLDFSLDKAKAIAKKYGAGVDIRYMYPEGIFSLASNMPKVTVLDIEKRFGLQDLRSYLDEADAVRREILASRKEKPRPFTVNPSE